MRETIAGIRRVSERYKTFAALGLIFVCGFLSALGLSSIWVGDQIDDRLQESRHTISRLQFELDTQSSVNRSEIARVAGEVGQVAMISSQTAAHVSVLLNKVDEISKVANEAAKTAKTAANTASHAAEKADDAAVSVKDAAVKASKGAP